MSIEHYNQIAAGERLPRHVAARRIAVDSIDGHRAGVETLHAAEREGATIGEPTDTARSQKEPHANPLLGKEREPERSLLDVKIEMADRMLESCDLCPHHCRVDRAHGQHGYCGVDDRASVHWEGVLCGEEREVIPSHEVFFSGCTMRCAFCYSHEHITRPMSGVEQTPATLAGIIRRRRAEGAISLNLVGGEPTVHIPTILKSLRQADVKVPVIWNSNMYITADAMEVLDGVVDLYLGDIHFGNDDCAGRLGRIPDYMASITTSFRMAVDSGAGVIIRHLVVPGHFDCCTVPSLRWAAKHFPDTLLHLMFQYVPDYRAVGDPVIGRPLTKAEMDAARTAAKEIGVRLYEHDRAANLTAKPVNPAPSALSIGDSVDILIHADGRIAFTRLLEELTPVARALNGGRVAAGCARNGELAR